MEDIYALVQCLTPAEWTSLTKYFSVFTTHDTCELKLLQLAELLRDKETCPTVEFCRVHTNYGKNDIAFDVLKTRLKEKILDFLVTDISADKKLELDESDYAIVRMHKRAAQFHQLFYAKKRLPILNQILDEIISLARGYEQYSVLVEHLREKKNMVSVKLGKKEYDKISKELEHALKCSSLHIKAQHYYYKLIMMADYDGKQDNKGKLSFLKKSISEIEIENADIKSANVSYSLKALELEYYQVQRDYEKARSICLEWLDIVRYNKSVYRRQRVGVVYDNLSRCEYYLAHFAQAAETAREAQKFFNLNSENYCIALEQEFYALFAMKEYDKAEGIANRMMHSATRKELGEFRYAKYNYLLANTLFKMGRYTEALNLVSQDLEISKDKTGWEIGLRTLKIMTLIEMNKHNEADLAVLALKEFFKYTDKKITEAKVHGQQALPVSKRDQVILNLLLQAHRKGFAFGLLHGKPLEKNMDLLAKAGSETSWEPFTHEVIPFHEWFMQKLGRKVKAVREDSFGKAKSETEAKAEGKAVSIQNVPQAEKVLVKAGK